MAVAVSMNVTGAVSLSRVPVTMSMTTRAVLVSPLASRASIESRAEAETLLDQTRILKIYIILKRDMHYCNIP